MYYTKRKKKNQQKIPSDRHYTAELRKMSRIVTNCLYYENPFRKRQTQRAFICVAAINCVPLNVLSLRTKHRWSPIEIYDFLESNNRLCVCINGYLR